MADEVPGDVGPSSDGVQHVLHELVAAVVLLVGVFGPQVSLGHHPDLLELDSDLDCGRQQVFDFAKESRSSTFGVFTELSVLVFLLLDILPTVEQVRYAYVFAPPADHVCWDGGSEFAAEESLRRGVCVGLVVKGSALVVRDLPPGNLREQGLVAGSPVLLLSDPDEVLEAKAVEPQAVLGEFGAGEDGNKDLSGFGILLTAVLVLTTGGSDQLVVAEVDHYLARAEVYNPVLLLLDLLLVHLHLV